MVQKDRASGSGHLQSAKTLKHRRRWDFRRQKGQSASRKSRRRLLKGLRYCIILFYFFKFLFSALLRKTYEDLFDRSHVLNAIVALFFYARPFGLFSINNFLEEFY